MNIKIDFVDFWPNYLKNDNYFYHLLSQQYDVTIDANDPDIVFMSCYGTDKLRYKKHRCKKVFFTGENRNLKCVAGGQWVDMPYDYDLTLTFNETSGKNIYFPLFVVFINWFNIQHDHNRDISYLVDLNDLTSPVEDQDALLQSKTRDCCFLVHNPTANERIDFCLEASQHFQVDCPGPVLNNHQPIDGRGDQVQKIDFIRKYKTTIAFENSKHPGYLTEKSLHGLATRCVPIYWGADRILEYINPHNIVLIKSKDDWNEAIQTTKRIIESEELYLKFVSEPAVTQKFLDQFNPEEIIKVLE